MHHRGYGHRGIHSVQDAPAEVTDGAGYGIEGSALALNDSCAGLTHILLYLCAVQLGQHVVAIGKRSMALLNRNIGNIRKRPRNERRITVLT